MEWVALVAAYVLFAQAIFGAFATGASAASFQLDASGHVICVSQGAERLPAGPEPIGSHHLPDCCLVGCSMFASAVLPAANIGGIPWPRHHSETPRLSAGGSARLVPDRGSSPAKPRAPPFPS